MTEVEPRPGDQRRAGRSRNRREEILRAALDVFAERGYRGASLALVAERVGLTQQGLLHYAPWVGTAAYTPYAQAFQNLLHKVPLRNGPASSYRLAPVIASAGPDRVMGLEPRTFAPLGAGANDNLCSVTQP